MATVDSTNVRTLDSDQHADLTARSPSVTRAAAAKRSQVDQITRLPWAHRLSRLLDAAQQAGAVQSYAWAPGTRRCIFEMKLNIATAAGPVFGTLGCHHGAVNACAKLIITGCKEALTLTGLFGATWFPGQPGQTRTLGTAKAVEILGNPRDIVIRSSRVTGSKATFRLSKEETRQVEMIVWGESGEELRHCRAQQEVEQVVEREVAQLPNSNAEFRRQTHEFISINIQLMRHYLGKMQGGYAYRRLDLEDSLEALEDLVGAMQAADVVFDPAARDMEIAEIIDRCIADRS